MTDETEAVTLARVMADYEGANWHAANFCETPNGETPTEMRERFMEASQVFITALDKHRIEGAGELERFEPLDMGSDFVMCDHEQGDWVRYNQAAATIAALKAQIDRLTEREAQAKLDGVRKGIEAMRGQAFRAVLAASLSKAVWDSADALSAEAIAKGEG